MNKQEFLSVLEQGLAALREEDRCQALNYYAEMIEDGVESGTPEETVVAGLDTPENISALLCEEYADPRQSARTEHPMPDELREYCPAGSVHTVVVDARHVRVQLRHSADGRVRVWFAPRRGEQISAQEAEGVFRFVHKPVLFGPGRLFGIVIDRRELLLEVPRGFSGAICAKTSNSGIRAEDVALGGKVQLVTGNSGIRVEHGVFETLQCKTSNAGITLLDTNAQKCEAATSNSKITAQRCVLDSCVCKTSNASILLEDLEGGCCEAVTDNARIAAERCRLARRLWLTTSNGPIHVDAVAAPDLSLLTCNGAIKGTLLGAEEDYAVSSRTSNAKSNLRGARPQNAPNSLRAVTSNGRIQLEFRPLPPEGEA